MEQFDRDRVKDELVKPSEESKPEKFDPNSEKLFLDSMRDVELEENCFTRFYQPNLPVSYNDVEKLTSVQREMKQYEHKDAVEFMAASWVWMKKSPPTDILPRKQISAGNLPTFSSERGCRALYQVVAEEEGKYILMACHMNVHGEHRGDLRFVEVNDMTVTKGFPDSVIGNLFLGDTVAVTELALAQFPFKTSHVLDLNPNERCTWMVRTMTVYTRKLVANVKFSILETGQAIVKGFGEFMQFKKHDSFEITHNEVYTGDLFVPAKVHCKFTEDHHPSYGPLIISRGATIPPYPPVAGTLYNIQQSSYYNRMFEIGTRAFKSNAVESAEILEFCALIGYSATKAVFDAHEDDRKFTMIEPKRDGNLVRFAIENPPSQPTEGLWHTNGRLVISGSSMSANAMVETIICEDAKLKFVARFSRDVPDSFDFHHGIYTVHSRKSPSTDLIQDGFFKFLPDGTNGKRIIEALYGGRSVKDSDVVEKKQYVYPGEDPIKLNEFQCEYVTRVLNGCPIILGNSPFGCGKSMTIVTAALYLFQRNRDQGKKEPQLLVTQSNYASVNLIDIARKTFGNVKDVKFIRYLSELNWKEIPDACRTEFDVPKLMQEVFVEWATERGPSSFPDINRGEMIRIVAYIKTALNVSPYRLNARAMSVFNQASTRKVYPNQMIKSFFALYQPDIIVVTANSLPGLSTKFPLNSVSTVQIDEASQLHEYTVLTLLTLLPRARFGLIGDVHQLPPYSEDELTGKLKEYGVGNAMERAVIEDVFTQAILRNVYRCHPMTTQLLGQMFYDNTLVSCVEEEQRNEFMTKRPGFWPNDRFPIMVVDNKVKGQPMGTSYANTAERIIVEQIVDFIMQKDRNGYSVDPSDIGVISYFSAQTSLLTEVLREHNIKCGTVDSFQGSEKEIVILCCTNGDVKGFMQLKNRLNVAMSRAKQVTMIIGNVEMLKKVEHWSTVVETAERNGCVTNPDNLFNENLSTQKKRVVRTDVSQVTDEMEKLLRKDFA